jgi:hypothetical protein
VIEEPVTCVTTLVSNHSSSGWSRELQVALLLICVVIWFSVEIESYPVWCLSYSGSEVVLGLVRLGLDPNNL